jgi:flagellar protein FlgJ
MKRRSLFSRFFYHPDGQFSWTAMGMLYGLGLTTLIVLRWWWNVPIATEFLEWSTVIIPLLLGIRPAQKAIQGIGNFASRQMERRMEHDEETPKAKTKKEPATVAQLVKAKTGHEKFVASRYMDAKRLEEATGISKLFTLGLAACESKDGKSGIGNGKYNIFGVKAGRSWKGAKVLCLTWEYSKRKDLKFPEIISINWDEKSAMWKYRVRDYFRSYDSFEHAMTDWVKNVLQSRNFKPAWPFRADPHKYVEALQNCKHKYATKDSYVKIIHGRIDQVTETITKLGLR